MKLPLKLNQVDFTKIGYSHVSKNGKNNVFIKYFDNTSNDFLIQTPELICVEPPVLNGDIVELLIGLDENDNNYVNYFIKFMKDLDLAMINLGQEHTEWFNSSNINFRNTIRSSVEYPDGILKLKVKSNTLLKSIKVTNNHQEEEIDLFSIKNKCNVKMVLNVYGLWIKDNNYGLYLKPVLMDFRQMPQEIEFIEDSDSDNMDDILDTEFDNQSESIMRLSTQYNYEDELTSIENPFELLIENIVDNNLSDEYPDNLSAVEDDIDTTYDNSNKIKNKSESESDLSSSVDSITLEKIMVE